ncbi:hypothetical protein [Methylobacterium durans]|uniref:hypothetical protein n=1 Tax=Methylobacterium durans TaxID=2202825 RepID=UPI0013A538B0|nr:hypothetical protein [Methylobacterium durans]
MPRKNRIAMGVGLGLAILGVLTLVATKPEVRPYLERARPYIGDWWRTGEIPAAPPNPHPS